MSTVLVLGHINPDTDTTCSAIAYAWYLKQFKELSTEAVITGDLNKETQFVLNKFGVPTPRLVSSLSEGDQIVIVDTNNPEELLPGYDKVEILEVVDHHKLVGGLSTSSPIQVTIRPVACTATLIQEMIGDANIPTEIAGLMLSAILSDTLNFTSPTTTEADRAAAQALVSRLSINPDELANEMFAAKSDLTGMSAEDIILVDSKVFTLGGKKLRISALETTLPDNALALQNELEATLTSAKTTEDLDGALLFVVDIVNSQATVIMPSNYEQDLIARSFDTTVTGSTVVLPGIVSRKKQIVPALEKYLG